MQNRLWNRLKWMWDLRHRSSSKRPWSGCMAGPSGTVCTPGHAGRWRALWWPSAVADCQTAVVFSLEGLETFYPRSGVYSTAWWRSSLSFSPLRCWRHWTCDCECENHLRGGWGTSVDLGDLSAVCSRGWFCWILWFLYAWTVAGSSYSTPHSCDLTSDMNTCRGCTVRKGRSTRRPGTTGAGGYPSSQVFVLNRKPCSLLVSIGGYLLKAISIVKILGS